MSKALDFRWHKEFQDGFTFTNDKYGPRPNITAVAGLIKRDAILTTQNIAYSVGILSVSARKILTQQFKQRKVCARCAPSLDKRTKRLLV